MVIRPTRDSAQGATYWLLTKPDEDRIVAKMRLRAVKRPREPRTHPGKEWFYVLDGTVRLNLGGHERLIETSQAAQFDTMTPHWMAGHGGPAELLTIFDRHGERAHLR